MKKPIPMLCLASAVLVGAVWLGFWQGDEMDQKEAVKERPVVAKGGKPSASEEVEPNQPTVPKVESTAVSAGPSMAQRCESVFGITNRIERRAAFDKMLAETMDAAGLKAILDTMIQMRKEGRRFDAEWFAFWQTIAHRDPKGAAALLESYDAKEAWYADAVGPFIQGWGSIDPAGAIQWLAANKALTGETLDYQTLNLISGYAGRDLKAATDYALSVFSPDEAIFRQLGQTLTSNAMQQGGVEGLLNWFNALPDGAVKQGLFQSVSSRLAEVSAERQREWLAAEAGNGYRNDQAYRDYMGEAAKTDPKGALDFAFSLPPSPHQPGVYVGVGYAAFEWLVRDEAAFAAYYQSLPANGVQRPQIVKALNDALGPGSQLPPRKRDPALRFLEGLK